MLPKYLFSLLLNEGGDKDINPVVSFFHCFCLSLKTALHFLFFFFLFLALWQGFLLLVNLDVTSCIVPGMLTSTLLANKSLSFFFIIIFSPIHVLAMISRKNIKCGRHSSYMLLSLKTGRQCHENNGIELPGIAVYQVVAAQVGVSPVSVTFQCTYIKIMYYENTHLMLSNIDF